MTQILESTDYSQKCLDSNLGFVTSAEALLGLRMYKQRPPRVFSAGNTPVCGGLDLRLDAEMFASVIPRWEQPMEKELSPLTCTGSATLSLLLVSQSCGHTGY